jgi:hypothetical protein
MYDNPDYNELYQKMKAMPDTPERLSIIRDMVDIVVEDAPWIPGTHRVSFVLYHSWIRNAKPHAITGGYLKYRDIDVDLRSKLRAEWNRPNYSLLAGGVVLLVGLTLALAYVGRAVAEGRAR